MKIYVLMAMIAVATAASTLAQDKPGRPHTLDSLLSGPAGFDIAGVRLEMPFASAVAQLKAHGYRIASSFPASSFREEAARKAADRLNKTLPLQYGSSTSSLEAIGPRAEQIRVLFAQFPEGARVSEVRLAVSDDVQTADAFVQQVLAKYGRQTDKLDALAWRWCMPGDSGCTLIGVPRRQTLLAHAGGVLTLSAGPDAERDSRRRMDAEVDRLAPKTDKTAF